MAKICSIQKLANAGASQQKNAVCREFKCKRGKSGLFLKPNQLYLNLTYLARKKRDASVFLGLGAMCPHPGAGCPTVILWLTNLCIIL